MCRVPLLLTRNSKSRSCALTDYQSYGYEMLLDNSSVKKVRKSFFKSQVIIITESAMPLEHVHPVSFDHCVNDSFANRNDLPGP